MPCRDWQDISCVSQLAYDEEVERHKKTQERADKLSAMLCEALTFIEKYGITMSTLSLAINEWWTEHKRRDALERAREEEKQQKKVKEQQAKEEHHRLVTQAVSKLTPDERKALGV